MRASLHRKGIIPGSEQMLTTSERVTVVLGNFGPFTLAVISGLQTALEAVAGGPHGLRVFDRRLLELTAFRAAFKLDPRTPEEDDAVLCDFINSTFTMGSFPGEATKVYAAFVDLLPDYGRVGRLALPRLMLALAG